MTELSRKMNKAQLAKMLDITTQTLDRYIQAGLPFDSAPGRAGKSYVFDLAVVVGWLRERDTKNTRGDSGTVEDARKRKLEAEARLAEMAAEKAAGSLLERSDVDAAVIGAFSRVRARLLSLPSKAAPRCVDRTMDQIGAVLEADVRDALQELSDTDLQVLVGIET